jgi:2-oxoglutarate dehydrogenase E1 component
MEASLQVPTATSVRAFPAKLLIDNRIVINNHLRRSRGGKVSFTHLVGYALIKALGAIPEMNGAYDEVDGKPTLLAPEHVNLGIAIDLAKPDGTRQLLVPSIKAAETMDFAGFWTAYEDIIRRARAGKLTVDDFAGTTISLTNPGTIGTVHSVPRLVKGQGTIVGVGALEYPAEFQGTSEDTLSKLGVSKTMTLTSTYDHRIIQGAQSGDFLRRMHQLLLGEEDLYDDVFRSLRIPYEPIHWAQDVATSHEDQIGKQARVLELIHAYRVRGHIMADTDPLEYRQRSHPDLDIGNHGLTLWDLDREFATGSFGGDKRFMRLRDILGVLRDSYCRTVGVEYMHIQDPHERRWIQQRIERPVPRMDREDQLRRLHKLNQAEAFETFLQTKYVGQKRFSLEGAESVIPLVDEICEAAAEEHLEEVCLGMAHRGRLNVLANIVGKSYGQIFAEFEGNIDPRTVQGSGDVKYHLGADGEFLAETGDKIKISLTANPSHLEAVDPVLEGIVRAKQDLLNRGEEFPVLALLIHGDAAFAGQGVVAETLNLSQLRGYRTGGTVHVVVNNQVGFTTSPAASRSSLYSTDVARMIQAPIFHVNGDDPEAGARVARLAFEFRQAFNKDVVIDLICYRKRGHNEGDDPSMTQPLMYDLIEQKRSVRKLYTEALVGRGDISIEDAEATMRDFQEQLEHAFAEVREADPQHAHQTVPSYPVKPPPHEDARTAVDIAVLKQIAAAHTTYPDGFTVHPKVAPQLQRRATMLSEGGIDWATAEIAAFGALLLEGRAVRLSGQDTRRGTFVQRFAVAVDRKTGAEYTPLSNVGPDQGLLHIYDSLLSEYAAVGFEYGYSVARPEALVLWEAQFGDFVNGAQSIIDEFISSGEAKWGQRSGVVMLLPHGYEGQGPDHSSARIERFLQLCADGSMTVAQPSTPASYFHLLRRQALGAEHRPMIVFTPKQMLRLKAAVSSVDDFTTGTFQPVVHDPPGGDPSTIRRVLLCSGNVSWQLLAERTKRTADDVAIARLEQLYPLPVDEILDVVGRYPNADVVWVQHEPANQGPWPFIALALTPELAGRTFSRVSRGESAAPAVGSAAVHGREQADLLERAFSSA